MSESRIKSERTMKMKRSDNSEAGLEVLNTYELRHFLVCVHFVDITCKPKENNGAKFCKMYSNAMPVT